MTSVGFAVYLGLLSGTAFAQPDSPSQSLEDLQLSDDDTIFDLPEMPLEDLDQFGRRREFLPITELDVSIGPRPGNYPVKEEQLQQSLAAIGVGQKERNWYVAPFLWEAPATYRRPTYFSDIPLERHGRSRCKWIQPGLSAARAAGQLALLPATIVMQPPSSCIYSYGYGPPAIPTTQVENGPCGRGTIWVHQSNRQSFVPVVEATEPDLFAPPALTPMTDIAY